jgi:tRNA A-37 threonylcarbamoyl transferase component Bud32
MPENSDATTIRPTEPETPGATVVRLAASEPSATDETLVRAGNATAAPPTQSVSSGSAGFAEETRLLLRRRLLVTHAAIGLVTGVISLFDWVGLSPLPVENMPRWALILPLLVFGQSVAGFLYLWRRPDESLGTYRILEMAQFTVLALIGGIARLVSLTAAPAESIDPRYPLVVYRLDGVVTNFPLIFAILLYGVLIPNTRRRSLIGVAILCVIPILAMLLAVAMNPRIRECQSALIPLTVLPLFMAGVIAVFSASRQNSLQRQAFDAIREAKQLGAYTLKKKLGEGGMGEVWLAEHRLLKRPCAMKFIRAELAANPDTARRFEREVRAVTALTHFNTVRIFDYGNSDDGSFYYVMEFLDGPTLDKLVKERGPLAPGRAVYLLRQLCGALAEAHAARMVHRDLKPGNILVAALGGQKDVAKLLDFGLVQDHSATESDDRITRAGTVLGTPTYMCPEQAAGETVDPRGDIYSLGAVAFFMLCGRPPFEGTSVGKLLTAHLTQPAPDVRSLRAEVLTDLAAVVAKCLAKDPKERFQTAVELEAALAACACAADWSACAAAQWWTPTADTVETPAPSSTSEVTQTLLRS